MEWIYQAISEQINVMLTLYVAPGRHLVRGLVDLQATLFEDYCGFIQYSHANSSIVY